MIQNAANNQYKLLSVINTLFTYVYDPYNKEKKVIRINPNLTDKILQKTVEDTRKFIINLYIKCEEDYINGIKIYEAIVESKILETTEKQIITLKNESQRIINDTNKLVEEDAKPVVINESNNIPIQPPPSQPVSETPQPQPPSPVAEITPQPSIVE
jgi:hypothetical protein